MVGRMVLVMIPVLEHPDIRRRALPISVQTYHWMQQKDLVPRRAELIRGVIVEKMSKAPLHTGLTDHIRELLDAWSAKRHWVRQESPLTLSDSEPEPDVSVVSGSRTDYTAAHPRTALLVVEVAVTTESADRELLPSYAAAGVAEVWLVLASRKQVERLTSPVGDAYTASHVFSEGETLLSVSLPGFSLPLAALFV
jgi:Uma2 family endonuclease